MKPRDIREEDVVSATYVVTEYGYPPTKSFEVDDEWFQQVNDGVSLPWSWTCQWHYAGVGNDKSWDPIALAFARYATCPATQLVWHAKSNSGLRRKTILVFASCDESVQGRCLTSQACDERGTVHVTLIDSRLTPARLGDIVTALADCDRPCPVVSQSGRDRCEEEIKNANAAITVFNAIAAIASYWSAPFGDLASPDLGAMARAVGAPEPHAILGGGRGISLAGGGMVVATVTPETARRISADWLIGRAQKTGSGDDTSRLLRVADTVWAELGLPPRRGHVAPNVAPLLVLCSQTGPLASTTHSVDIRHTRRNGLSGYITETMLLSGVPIAQVLAQARRIRADERGYCFDERSILDAPNADDLLREGALRAEDDAAIATIRRIAVSDECVRAIKERVRAVG